MLNVIMLSRGATTGAKEAGLLNKSSRLAPALGATKFITTIAMHLVTLC